jgi:hypothetical protein
MPNWLVALEEGRVHTGPWMLDFRTERRTGRRRLVLALVALVAAATITGVLLLL